MNDIDGLAREEEEFASLFERPGITSRANGIEISAEMTNVIINSTNSISNDFRVNPFLTMQM